MAFKRISDRRNFGSNLGIESIVSSFDDSRIPDPKRTYPKREKLSEQKRNRIAEIEKRSVPQFKSLQIHETYVLSDGRPFYLSVVIDIRKNAVKSKFFNVRYSFYEEEMPPFYNAGFYFPFKGSLKEWNGLNDAGKLQSLSENNVLFSNQLNNIKMMLYNQVSERMGKPVVHMTDQIGNFSLITLIGMDSYVFDLNVRGAYIQAFRVENDDLTRMEKSFLVGRIIKSEDDKNSWPESIAGIKVYHEMPVTFENNRKYVLADEAERVRMLRRNNPWLPDEIEALKRYSAKVLRELVLWRKESS